MLVFFVAGVVIRKLDGLTFRTLSKLNGDVSTLTIGKDHDALRIDCGVPESQKRLFKFCLSSSTDGSYFAVLGDSKAEALYYGLARKSRNGGRKLPSLVAQQRRLAEELPTPMLKKIGIMVETKFGTA